MSDIYAIIRAGWGDAAPEIKLQVIAEEVQNPLAAVRNCIQLLQGIDLNTVQGFPADFELWIKYLDQNAKHVWDVLDALLNPKERPELTED